MVTLERYKVAVRRLWKGKATVTVREGVLDERTGRTEPVERVLVEGAACRISHKTVTTTEPSEEAAKVVQSVMLYIDSSVSAPMIKCKKTPRKKCSFVAEVKGKR